MSKLQRLVADELGMEPGKPVSETKRVGYNHKQWRALKEVLEEKDDQITRLVDLVKFHRIELEQLTSESGYSHSMMMVPLEHYLTSVDVRHRLEPGFEQRKNYLKGELKTIAKMYWIVKDLISAVDDQSSHTRMEILANHLQVLFDSEIGILPDDLNYLSKFGDWSDIPSIAKATPYYGGPSVLLYDRKTLIKEKAETIYQLGSQDVNRLLLMDISEEVKAEILRVMSSSKIKELEVNTLKPLLLDSLVSLRKVCAVRLAQAQSISFVREVLDSYVNGEDYRFYNVIYWLDLKVSMPKRDSLNIYTKQLESMEE